VVEMTDFYSVLQRAVSSLPDSSGPNRRAVYDKARKALLKQLQSFDPPLPSSDVTSQRLALEDAIRKIENEIARQIRTQRALQSAVPAGGSRSRAIAPATPGAGAPDAAARAAEEERLAQRAAEAERARRHNAELLQAAVSEATAAPEPEVLGTPQVPATQNVPPHELAEAVGDEVMFEAESDYDTEQDEAPAEDDGIVDGEYDEIDPEDDETDDGDTAVAAVDQAEEKRQRREAQRAQKEEERRLKAERRSARKSQKKRAPVAGPRDERSRKAKAKRGGALSRALLPLILLALLVGAAYAAYTQREALLAVLDEFQEDPAKKPVITVTGRTVDKNDDRLPSTLDGEDTRAVTTTPWPPQPATDAAPAAPAADRTVGGEVTPFAPDGVATDAEEQAAALDEGDESADGEEAAAGPEAEPETEVAVAEEPAPEPEAAAPPPVPASDTPISEFTPSGSQTAVLYEEAAQAGEKGEAVPGGVEWSMVRQSIGGGDPEPVIRATATVPDRDMTTTVTIRENLDGALPASHLIEIAFDLPEGFAGGEVKNVPGLIMKESEQSRGEALRGAAARVSSGLFWIALSENPVDRENNLRLLRERDWIDIPILYDSGRRAILTLRKGSDGLQSVNAAIQAWSPG